MTRMKFICVLLVLSIPAAVAKKIEGILILKHDTLEVTLNVPVRLLSREVVFEKLQYRVKCVDKNGEKLVMKPVEVEEIQFRYNNQLVRMLSRRNSLGLGSGFSRTGYVFLKLEIDGYMKMFRYYATQTSGRGYGAYAGGAGTYSYTSEELYLQKGDGEIKRPRGLGFRKDLSEYLSDCPSLADRVADRDFKRRDLEFIVMFYNKNCAN